MLEIPAMYWTAFTKLVEIERYCRYSPTQTRGLPDQTIVNGPKSPGAINRSPRRQ
jgi:hypothetical protein